MLNIREVIRRTLKYLVLVIIVGFSVYSIPENKPDYKELLLITLIAGMTFCILDTLSPSIKIVVSKKEKEN